MSFEVSDTMQALLTNLKNMVSSENNTAFEPVLLTKAAFELLDNKSFAELPKDVQQLLLALQPQGMAQPVMAGESSSMNFLKQLVQYFMPRPAAGGDVQTGTAPQGNMPQGNMPQGQMPQGQGAMGQANPGQAMAQPATEQAQPAQTLGQSGQTAPAQSGQPGQNLTGQPLQPGNNAPQGQTAPGQMPNQAQVSPQGAQAAPEAQAPQGQNLTSQGQPLTGQQQVAGQAGQAQGQTAMPGQAQQTVSGTQPMPGQQAANQTMAGQTANQGQSAAGKQVNAPGQNPAQQETAQTAHGQSSAMGQQAASAAEERPQQAAMQQAKNQLLSQNMENTTQTMNALRDLAQLLLKDGNLTQKDALLMQSFVNGKEALLSAKETQQLQQLIRLCQANIPATVQQAALQQNIPDLPRLWAFMQLCDMSMTRNMTARQLKKAGKDVAMFVLSMRNSMEGDNSIVPGQRSLNFMLPMYMGEETTYPSYIHVYDEKRPDPETGELKKETWLRLCVLTDNIGAVELTCRVYNENQLDMRLFFSSSETANEFREQADALRGSLKDSALRLNELKIGAVGERRFM